MKIKLFATVAVALMLGACSTTQRTHTASTLDVNSSITNRSYANLEVTGTKVSYTLNATGDYKNGSEKELKEAAVAKLLEGINNADVLVAPDFEVYRVDGKIKSVTVKGYPAFYRNIHSATRDEAEIISLLGK
ncbi:MAG: hypothetical protein K2K52_08385 [Paramuribaculum sp.]|nr:hypothetical protein [Paramuribaculum sp.]